MPSTLLILGASARAAAHSAIRAGYRPVAADRFGDTDLAACCDAYRVDDYPRGLEKVAESLPPCPYMYTGALENHPALVDRIARTRRLYGNPGHVLRQVRDPFQVAQALAGEGLACPELSSAAGKTTPSTLSAPGLTQARIASDGPNLLPRLRFGPACDVSSSSDSGGAGHQPPADGGLWLRKPFKSGGGERISLVRASIADDDTAQDECLGAPSPFYFQRFVDGDPCSAVYVAAGGRAVFLGATQQLVGTAWTGATGFQYSGSLGPLVLPEALVADLRRIGSCLAKRFGLIGIIGVDAVIAENRVWTVEVNPRYTASVEVLERATDLKTIALQVRACRDGELPASRKATDNGYCGKAIIYADNNLIVPARFVHFAERLNRAASRPVVADIPRPEQQVAAGGPIVTVFAGPDSRSSMRARLESRVRRVRRMLYS